MLRLERWFFFSYLLFALLVFFLTYRLCPRTAAVHFMCPITNDNDDRGQRLRHIQVISSLRYFFFLFAFYFSGLFFYLDSVHIWLLHSPMSTTGVWDAKACPITNDNNDRGRRLRCIRVISSLRYFFFYLLFTLMAFFLLRLCPCMAATLTNVNNRGLRR